MAGIQINDTASVLTEVMTIFLGDQDERYVSLRANRKELSRNMNKFTLERKALLAMTQEDRGEDFDNEARLLDSDQARVYLAMNTAWWVRGAHGALDAFNTYDKEMLGKMADYVERCRLIV